MIYLNLIPSNLWYLNLRKMLSDKDWSDLSNKTRSEQNWTCIACGVNLDKLKNKSLLHCHEYWEFNDDELTVNLIGLATLCKNCHEATHFGLASINKRNKIAFNWICRINQWDRESTSIYIEASFEEWSRRSKKDWTINYDSIKDVIGQEYFSKLKKL